jgi:hypothetical protein
MAFGAAASRWRRQLGHGPGGRGGDRPRLRPERGADQLPLRPGLRAAGAAAVNLINGAFGVGAVAMPALIGLATAARRPRSRTAHRPGDRRWSSVIGRALGGCWCPDGADPGAVAAALGRARGRRRRPVAARAAGVPGRRRCSRRCLFMYVASEVATTSWAPTHVAATQLGAARAALVGVGVLDRRHDAGRFLAAAFAGRVRPGDLVLGAVAIGARRHRRGACPALRLRGLRGGGRGVGDRCSRPAVVWIEQRFGERAERVAPWILAAGNLGPVLGAPAVGLAVARRRRGRGPDRAGGGLFAGPGGLAVGGGDRRGAAVAGPRRARRGGRR